MKAKTHYYLNDLGIVNALGAGKADVLEHLLAGHSPGMGIYLSPLLQHDYFVGQVLADLPPIPARLAEYDCRNNQLLLAAAEQIAINIDKLKMQFAGDRIGIVLGTSTSGIAAAEQALESYRQNAEFPANYHYKQQEIGTAAEFLADYLQINGPAYVISTACSSSGKVFASARGLLELGLCDAVIVGGVDSLCELTLAGFKSLEAVASELTNPFSINRNGINIGEAAALFVLSTTPEGVELLGVGESSDAHHISAPEPAGAGAKQSMLSALEDANIDVQSVDYVNLHGTGTALNDAMESHAVFALFADQVACSSTKPMTGHTLGAAGATEAGICWLLLSDNSNVSKTNNSNSANLVAPHIFDGQTDPKLSKIALCTKNHLKSPVNIALSNSFAFGGNNVSVVLKRV